VQHPAQAVCRLSHFLERQNSRPPEAKNTLSSRPGAA